VIEVGDFLPGMEVLQQGGTTFTGRQGIIGVIDPDPCWVVRYPVCRLTREPSSCFCLPLSSRVAIAFPFRRSVLARRIPKKVVDKQPPAMTDHTTATAVAADRIRTCRTQSQGLTAHLRTQSSAETAQPIRPITAVSGRSRQWCTRDTGQTPDGAKRASVAGSKPPRLGCDAIMVRWGMPTQDRTSGQSPGSDAAG